jgi:glycerol uptake facilitator-like aquaporin
LSSIPLRWKFLVVVLIACGLGAFLAWAILLTSFCSHSRTAMPDIQQDIAYNCHGATVFISHLESTMRHWLIPIGGLFIFLGLLAAVGAFIAGGHLRIHLSIDVTDTSSRKERLPEDAPHVGP